MLIQANQKKPSSPQLKTAPEIFVSYHLHLLLGRALLYKLVKSLSAIPKDKMLAILSSMGAVEVSPADIAEFKRDKPDIASTITDDQIKARVILMKADRLYIEQYGMRSSRTEWTDAPDLGKKDELPVEKEFRSRLGLRILGVGHALRQSKGDSGTPQNARPVMRS